MAALLAFFILNLAWAPQAATDKYDTSELVNAAHQLDAADLPALQSRAEMGDARSQVLLGLVYEMGGAGVKPEPARALTWFMKAADQGIAWAQVWAADFYLSGGSPGIDRDPAKALALYKSAAGRGDSNASFLVGQMYFYGDGVPTDQREAAVWYRRAGSAAPAAPPMLALLETPCATDFCATFRKVVGAVLTNSANRFIDGWDEKRKEWDSNVTLPDSERCGLTSSDRSSVGDVENYFCDSVQMADEARGTAMAKQLADTIERTLPPGYSRRERTDMRPGPSTFFAMDGFPHIRVTFNTTPGSAQNRVTLLVGP